MNKYWKERVGTAGMGLKKLNSGTGKAGDASDMAISLGKVLMMGKGVGEKD